jgi:hypothetical protein
MIQETARVLDVFGDFQSAIGHFAIPKEMAELATQLVGQVTKILLTLSPSQSVRECAERKAMLAPLRDQLDILANHFLIKCSDFERDPSAFIEG